ncbi:MAG: adenylyltransferase/cytidyltransferase family protein [Myxococcales bacterium]|nr:adenylyltransferase/cytidyltransferase family protein [Myxococcales bacterium]
MNGQPIIGLEQLAASANRKRSQGKTIALCHGAFDLLHMGHIRHLQRARRQADLLYVTVTADRFVNKGPDRPVFGEDLRAEALAALACVDGVAIYEGSTGVDVIKAIKPDVYVEGLNPASLETGGVSIKKPEYSAVESLGGRVYFTEEITFSSSSLLNEHFDVFPEAVRKYLREFRQRYSDRLIIATLRSLRGLKILVVGDAIIDEYHYTTPLGRPGKGGGLAVSFESAEQFAGGAIAVANHLGEFCDDVTLATGIGQGDGSEHFIRSHLVKTVEPVFFRSAESTTLIKRRFVSADFDRLFEIYLREGEDYDPEVGAAANRWLGLQLSQFDIVVVPDFGNGFISENMVETLCEQARFLAVNTQINSGNRGFHVINRYRRADLVSLNEPELRLAAHDRVNSVDHLAEIIGERVDAKAVAVTMGTAGMRIFDRQTGEHVHVPALSTKVVDRIGAGDAFLALASLCVGAGLPVDLSGFVGSTAAAIDVQIVCNRDPVTSSGLYRYITTLLK